jgi:hypothetical protein
MGMCPVRFIATSWAVKLTCHIFKLSSKKQHTGQLDAAEHLHFISYF